MDDCIFCMIANGRLEAKRVYEDDTVVAFDDVAPQAPIHTLIIPKVHYQSMSDDLPAETLAALFGAVRAVAKAKGMTESGYRVIVNNGRDANQSVAHLHIHIMGGGEMSHHMVDFVAD
ncbi:MAG: histidine triad nucleotide-binding protein [Actinomycetota bacterium]|nr:histidine triad nucleotide-binding protein [Actinomycetota bacterium]